MRSGSLEKHDNLVGHIQGLKNPDGTEMEPQERMIEIANLVLAGADTTVKTYVFISIPNCALANRTLK